MISFQNDYSEGAHPLILKALQETNRVQQKGYGLDDYSIEARRLIQKEIENSSAEIHFFSGGTQANLTGLAAILKPWQSIISAESGHINSHEAGAPEATGHKIHALPSADGKIRPDQVIEVIEENQVQYDHMVKPAVVYISHPTEMGTVYTHRELEELSEVCRNKQLGLFMDGARLGAALAAETGGLDLPQIARLTDMFYIGGTKNGALLGEALVITREKYKDHFRIQMKQRGALLAKGRILGLQFRTLFSNGLYRQLGEDSVAMARKLSGGLEKQGTPFLFPTQTNQIFPIFTDEILEKLEREFLFYRWQKTAEDHWAVRLVTSWATTDESIELFLNRVSRALQDT